MSVSSTMWTDAHSVSLAEVMRDLGPQANAMELFREFAARNPNAGFDFGVVFTHMRSLRNLIRRGWRNATRRDLERLVADVKAGS